MGKKWIMKSTSNNTIQSNTFWSASYWINLPGFSAKKVLREKRLVTVITEKRYLFFFGSFFLRSVTPHAFQPFLELVVLLFAAFTAAIAATANSATSAPMMLVPAGAKFFKNFIGAHSTTCCSQSNKKSSTTSVGYCRKRAEECSHTQQQVNTFHLRIFFNQIG